MFITPAMAIIYAIHILIYCFVTYYFTIHIITHFAHAAIAIVYLLYAAIDYITIVSRCCYYGYIYYDAMLFIITFCCHKSRHTECHIVIHYMRREPYLLFIVSSISSFSSLLLLRFSLLSFFIVNVTTLLHNTLLLAINDTPLILHRPLARHLHTRYLRHILIRHIYFLYMTRRFIINTLFI